MKKHLLFLFSPFFSVLAFGQANLTQANFPTVGTAWAEIGDNHYGMHTIPPAGAGQTWDYSTAFNVTDTDGVVFLDPATLPPPFNTDFPNADMAIYSAQDTSAQYFISLPNGFYADGFSFHGAGAMPPLDKIDFMPDLKFFPAPLTYGTTSNNQSRATFIIPAAGGNPGYKYTTDIFAEVNCNAWGTLTTPVGTWGNTLRVRRMDYTVDSSFIDILGNGTYTFVTTNGPQDTSITHFFMNNTNPVVLMNIDEDPANPGTSDGASFMVAAPTGINTLSKPVATAYPNPVARQDRVTIRADRRFDRLEVVDARGRTVFATEGIASDNVILATYSFTPGLYVYRLMDSNGHDAGSGRFVVD